ncbi:hypothetical protein [Echinicola pacifica]|nr:hypothetical protein [Echinicola pacifica]
MNGKYSFGRRPNQNERTKSTKDTMEHAAAEMEKSKVLTAVIIFIGETQDKRIVSRISCFEYADR